MRPIHFCVLVVAAAVIGCGGDDKNVDRYEGDEKAVAEVIDTFAEAGKDGDGERICEEVFATALTGLVEREAKQDCADEVTENVPADDFELEADEIEVKDTEATADVKVSPDDAVIVPGQSDDQVSMTFAKEGEDWRLVRITD